MEVVAWSQRDLAVRLTAGRVTADIAKAFPGERIQIETTGSIVRVVGTQFSVSYEASGATVVAVTEGVVEVSGKGQAEAPPVRVTAGQTHRVPLVAVAPATAKKRPARGPKTLRKRPQAPAVRDVKPRDGFRVIEIDVPPQQAPNAR